MIKTTNYRLVKTMKLATILLSLISALIFFSSHANASLLGYGNYQDCYNDKVVEYIDSSDRKVMEARSGARVYCQSKFQGISKKESIIYDFPSGLIGVIVLCLMFIVYVWNSSINHETIKNKIASYNIMKNLLRWAILVLALVLALFVKVIYYEIVGQSFITGAVAGALLFLFMFYVWNATKRIVKAKDLNVENEMASEVQQPTENKSMNDSEEGVLYSQVEKELEEDKIVQGLWAKAYSESEGDVEKTKASYIALRVNQLMHAAKQLKGI